MIYGGKLKELKKPHRRKYPGKEKRLVRISIARFAGIGVHYFVSIHEEYNYIWDKKENDRRKLFFIGMAAPSILLSWITNIQDNIPQPPDISQEIFTLCARENIQFVLGHAICVAQ